VPALPGDWLNPIMLFRLQPAVVSAGNAIRIAPGAYNRDENKARPQLERLDDPLMSRKPFSWSIYFYCN
jgi:hypothetical protein